MAKEAESKKEKAAPDLIEKPREPMFSKTGFMVMIGSNVLFLVIALGVAFFLTGKEEEGTDETADTSGQRGWTEDDRWLDLDSITTPVNASGGRIETVRYTVLLAFDGGAAEQEEAIAHFQQSNRLKILRGEAGSQMKSYDFDSIRDVGFEKRYENALKETLNSTLKKAKISKVDLVGLRYE